jgi:hypothetical protein
MLRAEDLKLFTLPPETNTKTDDFDVGIMKDYNKTTKGYLIVLKDWNANVDTIKEANDVAKLSNTSTDVEKELPEMRSFHPDLQYWEDKLTKEKEWAWKRNVRIF